MKSSILAISTLLAAVTALILLPVSATADGGNALLVVGILAVFAADCGRTIKPLKPSASIVAFDSNKRAPATLSAAA